MSRSSKGFRSSKDFRSSEHGTVLGAAIGVALLSGALFPAAASATPVYPVITIVAPVLDISFGESDISGDQRIDSTPKRTTITLDSTVSFGKDSAKITGAARARLQSVAAQLKAQGAGSLAVTGYTDDLGSAAHGRTLSRQRAAAVASVLRGSLPVTGYSFTVVGKGEANPAVPNTSEANRKINRRVVIVYRAR